MSPIWLCFIWIPLAYIIALALFRRAMAWWEWLCLLLIPTLAIWAFTVWGEKMQIYDTEHWGGYAVSAEFYEEWTEHEDCTHTDDDGNIEHPGGHDTHHPPYWQVIDTNSLNVSIDKETFESLSRLWENLEEIDIYRMDQISWGDGDKWVTRYPFGNVKNPRMVYVTTRHTYENRIPKSNSTFRFPEVDKLTKQQYKLFDYPEIINYYECSTVLGVTGPMYEQAIDHINYLNATLGAKRQVRIYVLVFVNQPRDAAFKQEDYWQGGNKNEFVLCIGTDAERKVTWAECFSWTKVEALKVEAKSKIMEQAGQKLSLDPIARWLGENISTRFIRRQFKEFDYLAIEPPTGWVITSHILTMIICGLWLWFAISNDYTEEDPDGSSSGFRYRRW